MLVRATRFLPDALAHGAMLAGLFLLVVLLQAGVTSGLRAAGVGPGAALFVSGAAVLAAVLGAHWGLGARAAQRVAAMEAARARQGLPDGPCCVLAPGVRAPEPWEDWAVEGHLRVHFPRVARRLGVEGYALLSFEIGADGRAKSVHCLDCWPAEVFQAAAAHGLKEARFTPRPGVIPRFGTTYQAPFLFRIAGAAELSERGIRARKRRPRMLAAMGAARQAAAAAKAAALAARARLSRRA